jgi:hypothetical protein
VNPLESKKKYQKKKQSWWVMFFINKMSFSDEKTMCSCQTSNNAAVLRSLKILRFCKLKNL